MKTLDEVIKGLEMCISGDKCVNGCPYAEEDCLDYGMEKDALHYLKEYQGRKEALRHWNEQAISEQQNIVDAYMLYKAALEKGKDNVPLTWDELRTMEGKPVWVEGEHGCIWGQKAWSLIRLDPENDDIVICISTDGGVHYEYAIGKEDYGTDWQAYRKERS